MPAAQLPEARLAVQALQTALRTRHPQLQTRLLQRAQHADQPTLMEVYAQPAGVDNALQQDIERQAALHLAPLGPPAVQRHVEVFDAG